MTLESVEKLRELVKSFHSLKSRWDTLAAIDEVEREIERDYMKLPVDAEGVPIHVGDVMCSAVIREKGHKVIASAIFEDGFVEYGSDNGLIGPLCQEDWVHVKPDPLKKLLHDACMNATRICCEQGVGTNVHVEIDETGLAEYAERIRELMEVDT